MFSFRRILNRMDNNTQTPQQRIILDTNILSRLDNTDAGVQIILYLLELIRRSFGFAISDITIYELLRGNSKEKEKKMLNLLSSYFRYYLTDNVLIAAAQLDNIMKMENIKVQS